MAHKVLVLGAGLVARPLIRYLLSKGFELTVADKATDRAREYIDNHPNARTAALDLGDAAGLDALVAQHDLVVSMVPYIYHSMIARRCLAHRKHLVTASYVSNEMRELGSEAKKLDLVFLNELGLDPGIDHLSAMRVIRSVHARGGKVLGFRSFCGGLPAPEANDNPWNYKFSWSPRGVLLAGRNPARFLMDGKVVEIEAQDLFLNFWPMDVPGVGALEAYPNRNSLQYAELYGLPHAKTMLRGTFRYPGWCRMMKSLVDLGWISLDPPPGGAVSLGNVTAFLLHKPTLTGAALREEAAKRIGLPVDHDALERLEWAGLFGNQPAPVAETVLDTLSPVLESKLVYKKGERDMNVMVHYFDIEEADGSVRQLQSSLVDFGVPNGDTSMARTVSLPAALGAELILEGKIAERGVVIPLSAEFGEPILDSLEEMGIRFVESWV